MTGPVTIGGAGPSASAARDALHVFISYARADSAIADRMVAALERRGLGVSIDRRDLPFFEEWQRELTTLIAECDTVVWLVSPESVASRWCRWELGEVARLAKRLVPVRIRDIDPETLPEALGKLQLLPAEGRYEPALHEDALVEGLETDHGWLKLATRISERARDWIGKERDDGLLLRGTALREAEAWSATTPRGQPPRSAEALELIIASRDGQTRRQRTTVAVAVAAAVIGLGLAATAFLFQQRAADQAEIAMARESASLAALSRLALADDRPQLAAALALSGWPRRSEPGRPMSDDIVRSLAQTLPRLGQRRLFELPDAAAALRASADASLAVATLAEGQIYLLDGAAPPRSVAAGRFALFAAPSPDGKSVLAAFDDGSLALLDATNGETRLTLDGQDGEVASIAWSPDGRLVAAASSDGTVRLWKAATGAVEAIHAGQGDPVDRLEFSPAGRDLLAAGADGVVRAWPLAGGAAVEHRGHEGAVLAVAWSRDGSRFASSANDRRILVWDRGEAEPLAELEGFAGSVEALAFTPDGGALLAGSSEGPVYRWRIATTPIEEESLAGHAAAVTSIAFGDDGNLALTASADGSVRVWSMPGGAEIAEFGGHEKEVVGAVLLGGGASILSASRDRTARLWEMPSRLRRIRQAGFDGDEAETAIARDTETIAVATGDGLIRVFGPDGSAVAHAGIVGAPGPRGLAVSADGKALAALAGDGILRLAVLGTQSVVHVPTGAPADAAFAFDASGGRFALAMPDATLRLLSVEGDRLVGNRTVAIGFVARALAFSAAGDRLLAHGGKAAIVDWDGATVRPVADPGFDVGNTAFSPDGSLLALAAQMGAAVVVDAATGEAVWRLDVSERLTATIDALAISPDNAQLAIDFGGAVVELWNIGDDAPSARLDHRADIGEVAFLADTGELTTMDFDGVVRFWDRRSGAELAAHATTTSEAHAGIWPAARLLATLAPGSVSVWALPPPAEADPFLLACDRLGDPAALRAAARREYFVELPAICGEDRPAAIATFTGPARNQR